MIHPPGWQNEHVFSRNRVWSACFGARWRKDQTPVNASPKDPCEVCFKAELALLFQPTAREKRLVKAAELRGKKSGVALALLEVFQVMDKGPHALAAEHLCVRIVKAARAEGCEPKFKIGAPRKAR